ncbi:MAG: BON domain-containing protein [Gaiellaceae bacterium]
MRKFGFLAALTAGVYFFDPQKGAKRRNAARDRALALFRGVGRRGARAEHAVGAEAKGVAQQAQHVREEEKPQPDDATLAHKVETEIFRDEDVPKGQINVNAENGKIVLRGEVGTQEMISDLGDRARSVQGVEEVENLLHVSGTPAKMHQ